MFALKALTTLALATLSAQGASVQKRSTSGRGTFYDVGMGNCGWQNSASEFVVALNTAQYGSTSQVSGACGQTITVNYNGKSAQARVVDSCPTCPYGGLDLSTGLFSHLTNGNMGLGVIQLSWDWGSGSSGNNNNNNNKSNNNKSNNDNNNKSSNNDNSSNNNNNNKNQASSTSSSQSSSTPSPTSSSAATATPTNEAQKTVHGVPAWWAQISSAGCDNVNVPEGVDTVAIAPSGNAEEADLQAACGKWVEVTNEANGKKAKVIVTSFLPDYERNSIYLADGYMKIADMNGDVPSVVDQVKWGFLN